jgi:excinuclease ABC subunit A
VREGLETRLAGSFRPALNLADGIAVIETAPSEGEGERITYSEKFACPVCDGLGMELFFDERLVVPDQGLTLLQGAIAPWAKSKSPYFTQTIDAMAKHYGFDKKAKWKDLPD